MPHSRSTPCYFSHPDDMRAMIRAVRLSREIAEQAALAPGTPGTFPGPEVCDDDEIAAYVARDVSTWFHLRHVPHGRRSGRSGRSALRVHGITGLRVADASIMPDIVSVNTNAAATVIGWKRRLPHLPDARRAIRLRSARRGRRLTRLARRMYPRLPSIR